jgi:Arc/MetJ-type ribon-helix-helix transcriptional regulator
MHQIGMPTQPEKPIRKSVSLPATMWEDVEEYRVKERIATASETIRRLVHAALRREKRKADA